MDSLALGAKLVRLSGAVAAGTADITTAAVDTQGYQGVAFVAVLGDVTATCVLGAKAQAGSAANGSDAADIAGAATTDFTAGATDADNKFIVLEVVKTEGAKRYVRAVFKRGTANAAVESIVAVLLGPVNKPVTQSEAIAAVQKSNQ